MASSEGRRLPVSKQVGRGTQMASGVVYYFGSPTFRPLGRGEGGGVCVSSKNYHLSRVPLCNFPALAIFVTRRL